MQNIRSNGWNYGGLVTKMGYRLAKKSIWEFCQVICSHFSSSNQLRSREHAIGSEGSAAESMDTAVGEGVPRQCAEGAHRF